jgi:hypothetical protein
MQSHSRAKIETPATPRRSGARIKRVAEQSEERRLRGIGKEVDEAEVVAARE